jgi:hypothetical protein
MLIDCCHQQVNITHDIYQLLYIQGGREVTVHRFVYNNNNYYYYYLLFIVWVYGDFSATLHRVVSPDDEQ